MEDISILHPDNTERSTTFKFTNATDTDKEVYIKDITLYSFLRNIDWVNNVFSWVEVREIPLDKLVCNPPNNTASSDGQVDTEQPSTSVTDPLQIPILCCLRIPPGTYKNTESIIAMINSRLNALDGYDLIIKGAQAIHKSPACAYDINEIIIREKRMNLLWYPAVIDVPIVLNKFDIALTDPGVSFGKPVDCVPVLEYVNGELSLPSKGSLNYNNLSLYNSDLISKIGSNALTAHAIAFDNGITNTLTIDKIKLTIDDLYVSEYGLIRYRENGNDYTEFIINPSNKGLIDEISSKYFARSWVITDENNSGGALGYPEITTNGIYKIFSCFAYPFFPVSTKLYLYNCNTPYVDKMIETRLSTERLFGIQLASMEVGSECTNQSQTIAETLDIVTSIKPHTIPVNSIITIPHGSTTSIYVVGDNQHYPLWRSSHYLTYKVIN